MPRDNVSGRHLPAALIRNYQHVLEDFQPDVIHIHGTESFQGLLTGRGYLRCPSVISIQGILDACSTHYLDGIPLHTLLTSRTCRDWLRCDGLIEQKIRWRKRARREREVFSKNNAFIGRTLWERAHTYRLNPNAKYFHCDETMRIPFYKALWNISKIRRHSIFASGASYPIKGFHVLVKAIALLRDEFPNITVRTPLANFYPTATGIQRLWKDVRSTGYAKYLTDLMRSKGVKDCFFALPLQDAEMMVQEFTLAHAFVLPSAIENSPNALGEAMLLGTPCVVSYVGGVPSMMRDGESALAFPACDEGVLAEQIRSLFLNDELAGRLSANARDTALRRHAPETIVRDMLAIYSKAMSKKS